MPKITIDLVVEHFVITREEIKELESKVSELKALQEKRTDWLAAQMQGMGVENVKTKHGTAYTTVAESVTVADADIFFDWVKQHEAWSFIERRAAKSEVLNLMGDKEESGRPNPPPPGVNYTAIKKVNIRKG